MKLKYRQIPNALFALTLAILFIPSCSLMKAGPPPDAPTGNWKGNITTPDNQKLDVYLEFTRNADGGYGAVLRAPQDTDDDVPVRNIVLEKDILTFDCGVDKIWDFKGTVEDKITIRGEFSQGDMLMQIEFNHI